MNIMEGETLSLRLPGFSGQSASFSVSNGSSCPFDLVYWDGLAVDLRVFFGCNISAGTTHVIIIDSSVGIRLPFYGLAADDPTLTISTNARAGPVLSVSIMKSQSVGSFADSAVMSFSGSGASESTVHAGHEANMILTFTAQMKLTNGDNLTLFLPDFQLSLPSSRPNVSDIVNCTADAFGLCSKLVVNYSNSGVLLTFTLTRSFRALQNITFFISSSLKILLPPNGIRQNSSGILLGTDAVAGAVQGALLRYCQPVGAFQDLKLSFDPRAMAGKESNTFISFLPKMGIAISETIFLKLPGFTKTNGAVICYNARIPLEF
jgi:hypothetical protein